jgi:hypothetical protein
VSPTSGTRRARLARVWHPDDRANTREVAAHLTVPRTRALRRTTIPPQNPQVSTLQHLAAHVGAVLTLTLHDLPGGDDQAVAVWRDAALSTTDPDAADRADRQATLAHLTAAWKGVPNPIPAVVLAERMGTADSVVTRMLNQVDPWVSTWQIWARAMGGQLAVGVDGETL